MSDYIHDLIKESIIELRKDNHWDVIGWEREPSTKQSRVGGFQYEAEGSEKSKPKIIDESKSRWKRVKPADVAEAKRIPSWKKVLSRSSNPKKLAALLAAAGIGAGIERLGGGEKAKELYNKAKEIIPFWNADMENSIVKEVVGEFLQKGKKKDSRLERAGVAGFNKPKRTPKHPKKSHVVVAKEGDKVKTIRFGEQGASTAGDPKKGESTKMKKKRKSFKARHQKNIKRGKMSAAYWADKVKW